MKIVYNETGYDELPDITNKTKSPAKTPFNVRITIPDIANTFIAKNRLLRIFYRRIQVEKPDIANFFSRFYAISKDKTPIVIEFCLMGSNNIRAH